MMRQGLALTMWQKKPKHARKQNNTVSWPSSFRKVALLNLGGISFALAFTALGVLAFASLKLAAGVFKPASSSVDW